MWGVRPLVIALVVCGCALLVHLFVRERYRWARAAPPTLLVHFTEIVLAHNLQARRAPSRYAPRLRRPWIRHHRSSRRRLTSRRPRPRPVGPCTTQVVTCGGVLFLAAFLLGYVQRLGMGHSRVSRTRLLSHRSTMRGVHHSVLALVPCERYASMAGLFLVHVSGLGARRPRVSHNRWLLPGAHRLIDDDAHVVVGFTSVQQVAACVTAPMPRAPIGGHQHAPAAVPADDLIIAPGAPWACVRCTCHGPGGLHGAPG